MQLSYLGLCSVLHFVAYIVCSMCLQPMLLAIQWIPVCCHNHAVFDYAGLRTQQAQHPPLPPQCSLCAATGALVHADMDQPAASGAVICIWHVRSTLC